MIALRTRQSIQYNDLKYIETPFFARAELKKVFKEKVLNKDIHNILFDKNPLYLAYTSEGKLNKLNQMLEHGELLVLKQSPTESAVYWDKEKKAYKTRDNLQEASFSFGIEQVLRETLIPEQGNISAINEEVTQLDSGARLLSSTDEKIIEEEETLTSTFAWDQYNGLVTKMDKIPFISFSASIFGYDIPVSAYGDLYDDLKTKSVKNPPFIVTKKNGASYDNRKQEIRIGRSEIYPSFKEHEKKSAKLLHILLEEYGHHIDNILRNEYSSVGGDASFDEGAKFAFALPDYGISKNAKLALASYNGKEGDHNLYLDNTKLYEKLFDDEAKEVLVSHDGKTGNGRYEHFSAGRGEDGNKKSYGHQSIEDALIDAKFEDDIERLEIYFGNWVRDYSQVIDSKILEFDINKIIEQGEGSNSINTASSTNSGNKQEQNHISRKSLTKIVNVLAQEQFEKIYNGYEQKNDLKSLKVFDVQEKMLGVYIPKEHLDNPKGIEASSSDADFRGDYNKSEGEIDAKKWYKNYFKDSISYAKEQLVKAVASGESPQGRIYFGQALHVMEDLYSHSNFCELLLIRIANESKVTWVKPKPWTESVMIEGKKVYPLVTGTFGSVDTMVSFLSILEKKMDAEIKCELGGERTASVKIALILLEEQAPNSALDIDKKLRLVEKLGEYNYPGLGLCYVVKQMISSHIHNLISFLARQTLAEIPFHQEVLGTNPTHSQVGKDHDDSPLHVLAAESAKIMIKDMGLEMKKAWANSNANTLKSRVDAYFIHPNQINLQSSIKSVQSIYAYTKEWADANPQKLSAAARYEGEVEHTKKELKMLAEKSDASFDFLIEMYKKYGN